MGRFFVLAICSIVFVLVSVLNKYAYGQSRDYDVFKSVLEQNEARLDLHAPLDSMLSHLSNLEKVLSPELLVLDQYREFSRTLAKVQSGHTQIHPSKAVLREWLAARNSLPIDYIIQGKKLYSNKLLAKDRALIEEGKSSNEIKKKLKPYTEIISIDNQSLEQMMLEIAPFLSSDEGGIDFKYFQAGRLFDFFRHLSHPFDTDSIQIQYLSGKDTLSMYLRTGTAPVHTMNLRLKKLSDSNIADEKNYGEFHVVQSNVGYFRFKSFKSSFGEKYESFLANSFKQIETKSVEKIIIDVRGNTGGAMQYSLMRYFVGANVELGRYVIEKPKIGFESRHINKLNSEYKKHKKMSRIQRRRNRLGLFNSGLIKTDIIDEDLIFKGEIIVITDEGSFSSASILACHLKTLCGAKIIGRTAGGSFYRGNAGSLTVQLPSSKFMMYVNPNTFYSHLPESNYPQLIKQPDLPLNPGYLKEWEIDDFYLKAAIQEIK